MHGAAASPAAALALSIHFGKRNAHRHSARQCMPVFAVSRYNPVAPLQHRDDSDGDRLLAIVEMQKSTNLSLRVKLGAFVLKAPDADHLREEIQVVRPREMGLVGLLAHRSSLLALER